jgi:hypothetical protein
MGSTTEAAEALAAELRETLEKEGSLAMIHKLSGRYGDKVAVTHDPPIDGDKVFDGNELREIYRTETGTIANVLTDFRLDGPITVEGNKLITDQVLSGRTADGTEVSYRVVTTFTLDGDNIVALNSKNDMEGARALGEALQAAGIARPEA